LYGKNPIKLRSYEFVRSRNRGEGVKLTISVSLVIGIFVFLLIALRHLVPFRVKYWHIMALGSLFMLIAGAITPKEALKAIDLDVILSLFGMFAIGSALEKSGYLNHLFYKFLRRSKSVKELIFLLVFTFGISSALFMNDTIAVIGVPVILLLSKNYGVSLEMLTLILAFSVTTGSILSPLGNPQNLLIALQPAFRNPFVEFLKYLLLPTILGLLALYFYFRLLFKGEFHSFPLSHSQEPIKDKKLKKVAKISLYTLVFLVFIKILEFFFDFGFHLKTSWIPIISAIPIFLFYSDRKKVLKGIDFDTLLFFVFMFIVTEALTKDVFFKRIFASPQWNPLNPGIIVSVSILLSQLISNVPLTIFYLKILQTSDPSPWILSTLAFGSTIAGNFTLLGAASNIIILQNLEKRTKKHVLNFFEFAKYGIPLLILQVALFYFSLLLYRLLGWI